MAVLNIAHYGKQSTAMSISGSRLPNNYMLWYFESSAMIGQMV